MHRLLNRFVICSFATAMIPLTGTAAFLHATRPLKNRYIVTLKDSAALPVDSVAKQLAGQFGGRLLGTMSHAMRALG